MINEQTEKMIDVIKTMSEKNKLRLAICLADSRLREIDEEYRTTYVNMAKYGTVLLTTAMITELPLEEQNKVVMFLINSIN